MANGVPTISKPPSASSPFAAFSFGSSNAVATSFGSSTPSTFSFGAQTNNVAAPSAQPATSAPFSGFSFTTPSSVTAPSTLTSTTIPAVPSSFKAEHPSQFSSAQPTLSDPPPEAELRYYSTVRGLNAAVSAFLASTIEAEPFVDLSSVMLSLASQYTTHLDKAIGASGWRPTAPPKPSASRQPPSFSMPAVGSFTLPTAKTSVEPNKDTTSTPSPSPFKFPAFAPPTPTPTPKKPTDDVAKIVNDVLTPTSTETPPPAFSFGKAASQGIPQSNGTFSFPPIQTQTSDRPPNENASVSPAKLGKFGPGGSQPQLTFGGASSSSASSQPVGFRFGSGSTGSAGFSLGADGVQESSSASPVKSFTFGGSTSFGSTPFGSSSGFSFGSNSTPAASSFTFGAKPSTTPAQDPDPVEASGGSNGDKPEPSENLADSQGVGEEDEDTLHEWRARLLRLEEGKFVPKGVGPIRLKRSSGDGKRKRRLLMRTDGGGAVVLVSLGCPLLFADSAEHDDPSRL